MEASRTYLILGSLPATILLIFLCWGYKSGTADRGPAHFYDAAKAGVVVRGVVILGHVRLIFVNV